MNFLQYVLAVATATMTLGASGTENRALPLEISSLSNRADLLSGGNALVEVRLPAKADPRSLRVRLNGKDVTAAFVAGDKTHRRGLLDQLAIGRNVIVARAKGARAAELVVTNAPRGGPVLAGPQVTPYVCATRAARAATATTAATNASGFSTEAVDAQCNIATEMSFFYRSTQAGCSMASPNPSPPATAPANACFKPYAVGAAVPVDLATITTDKGLQVPYIVRLERGVINRGIYEMAVLFDPAKPWSSGLAPQSTWNGKLEFVFGGSSGQARRQFRPASLWNHDAALAKGWLVATNSLIDASRNSNRAVMTDTVMMMKEDVIERYGPLKYTVGNGCSAGSMTALTITSTFPGLLDGLLISCALNDPESSNQESVDCGLLVEAYDKPRWRELMASGGYSLADANRKKAAINGHADHTACIGWYNSFGPNKLAGNFETVREVIPANRESGVITERSLPEPTNLCQLPVSQVFDPIKNPSGLRCSQWDHAVSVFGRRTDGAANSTRDNTGVQYGLKALVSGTIKPEEFVTLNEIIGGVNRDGFSVPERAVADTSALETAYRSGLMPDYKLVARVPILDFRGYDDSLTPPVANTGRTGLHQIWKSFANRERLVYATATAGNYAMWRYGISPKGFIPSDAMADEGFAVMDQWLANLSALNRGTLESRVLASRPATAADHCLLSTDAMQSTKVADPAACDADPLLRRGMSPREAAGGPLANDILKCRLKPVAAADYAPVELSATQLNRLRASFPDGVCDYNKPGVGAQPSWGVTSFASRPGGQPLPAAPVSTPR
ncbi:DUF6351 family protein [Ramlibacter sp. WS9]|uniref:DUF6351 family protein n=1 Tax=Ramlibacter sp. WS9 TaxID=1882741 RepID=UPI0011429C84|nr:DUF6351 family protein [Ramlibacter sp. WS9]ROZ78086.1 hypothetical protein EEB15_06455 [Ramlibacter sp. WS9]HSV36674.1 DUF6351 family protein [Ramlibacter sp.]